MGFPYLACFGLLGIALLYDSKNYYLYYGVLFTCFLVITCTEAVIEEIRKLDPTRKSKPDTGPETGNK